MSSQSVFKPLKRNLTEKGIFSCDFFLEIQVSEIYNGCPSRLSLLIQNAEKCQHKVNCNK